MHFPIDSSTHYPAFKTVGLHCQTPTLTHACLCREAVCTIFMMVFGMTRPRGELTTYRARGGHATDWANPTRSPVLGISQIRHCGLFQKGILRQIVDATPFTLHGATICSKIFWNGALVASCMWKSPRALSRLRLANPSYISHIKLGNSYIVSSTKKGLQNTHLIN